MKVSKEMQYQIHYNYEFFFFHYYYCHLFGSLVKRGKKLWAFNFLVNANYALKRKQNMSPYILYISIFSRISPLVILYPLKLGGIIYRVPRPISLRKQKILAIRWLIKGLREKNKTKNIKFEDYISTLLLSLEGKGPVIEIQKVEYLYSEANRFLIRRFKK